ncbi:MAG TPA: hypothetical protein VGD71_02930 [Kribbella sp.]
MEGFDEVPALGALVVGVLTPVAVGALLGWVVVGTKRFWPGRPAGTVVVLVGLVTVTGPGRGAGGELEIGMTGVFVGLALWGWLGVGDKRLGGISTASGVLAASERPTLRSATSGAVKAMPAISRASSALADHALRPGNSPRLGSVGRRAKVSAKRGLCCTGDTGRERRVKIR